MKWLKRLFLSAAGLFLIALSALLVIDNATPVPLRLLTWETSPAPVFVWLLAAFSLGLLAGSALGLVSRLRRRGGRDQPQPET